MASITSEKNGCRTIQFVGADGRRRSIRLGKIAMRQVESIKLRVEALLASVISGLPIDRETAGWVRDIGDELADKLARVGLIPERASAVLGEFLDQYIAKRTDVKPRTKVNMQNCCMRLLSHFDRDRLLSSITPGDADAWLLWMRERYANGTISRTVKYAKQFFRSAVRSRLIPSNPFEDVKPPSQANSSRLFFVTLETTRRVLDACPDHEWRLIVALCRYGGVRCPSELLPLRWDEVLWDDGKFLVHSPKTEHHEDGADRWVPIFPELRPFLEASFEAAEPGAVHLINRYRDGDQNLRSQLLRIIRRAGVSVWPKLFQNLRSIRETELAAVYPLHVVCAWIGNSAAIAAKHYLQVTDDDFARAAKSATEGGAESGAVAVQNPVQSVQDSEGQSGHETTESRKSTGVLSILSALVLTCSIDQVRPEGLEPPTPWFEARCSVQLSYGRSETEIQSPCERAGSVSGRIFLGTPIAF